MTEEQKIVHKEFRTYLRLERGKQGNMLNMLIDAIERALPQIVKEQFDDNFESIYNDIYTIEQMLNLSHKIKANEGLMLTAYLASKALDLYIEFYAQKHGIELPDVLQTDDDYDDDIDEEYVEGEETDVVSKRYERSQKAKKACIEARGCKCYVCGFDFEKVYGEFGKGYIEVHHLVPVSQRGGTYKLNPKTDLVPLCSNCHSMVHRKREVMDVEELKIIIKSGR